MTPQDLIAPLNEAQRKIACTLDRPLFVEAGAGSGKTFTLTQRIAWALAPGSGENGRPFVESIDQVLIITFTEAAAREIRERVRKTLREAGAADDRLREAALAVDGAWISTIHGMCSRILHRHALDLGLDPRFAVASENEASELLSGAMDKVVGEARRDPAYRGLFETFEFGRYAPSVGFTGILGLVDGARSVGARCPGGLAALRVPASDGSSVRDAMAQLLQAAEQMMACKLTPAARDKMEPLLEVVQGFAALAPSQQTADRADEALEGIQCPRASKATTEARAELKQALDTARAEAKFVQMAAYTEQILELARRVEALYAQLKREASLLDNDDLIELALIAVRDHPEIARDYAGRFRLVMVDEFQDTDAKQLELIGMLAGQDARHLCTVGDAQQSIYRFRGADVGVFRNQGARLGAENHVRLDVNYRSHAAVLSLVERVCGGGAPDATGQRPAQGVLKGFMHLDPNPQRKDGFAPCDLPRIDIEAVMGPSAGGGPGKAQSAVMAAAIADRFAAYADHGVSAGKMALLLGATTHADLYIDAMRARGIECVVTGGSTFTSTAEVEVMCALLHTLANRSDTQSGLFRLFASEMFELDAADFCLLGTRTQEKLDAPAKRPIDQGIVDMNFYDAAVPSARLARASQVLRAAWGDLGLMPVADLCLRVARDSGWLARLEKGGEQGKAKAANVLAAVRYIRDLTDRLGLGPARAALEFDRWLALAKVPPASLAGGVADTVRVMTIHASKGLEFPLVAVAECWRNPKSPTGFVAGPDPAAEPGDPRADWIALLAPEGVSKLVAGIAPDEGAALKGGSRPMLVERYLALKEAAVEAEQAEKARLLYVGLTRAEEGLILGLNCPVSKKEGMSSDLARGVSDTLVQDLMGFEAGEYEVDYDGDQPAVLRVTRVAQGRSEKGGPLEVTIEAAGSLAGLAGTWVDPTQAELLVAGVGGGEAASSDAAAGGGVSSDAAADSGAECQLYEIEAEPPVRLTSWRAREGVFSYSSAHRTLEEEGALGEPASRPSPPTARARAAEAEGAPDGEGDADKATNLGSAFHELAQTMVESGREPSDEQVEARARYWNLSPRATIRLRDALARWCESDLRREALSGYNLLRAEVPFFVPANPGLERFGQHMEGAIDLLCCNVDEAGILAPKALLIDYKTGDAGLTADQIRERHAMQAEFYAGVLHVQGFEDVVCAFVCVEQDAGLVAGGPATGQPHVARYCF